MPNLKNKLTSDEIQLLQKFGIDSASDNLKAGIENILEKSKKDENQKTTFRKANLADIDGIIKVQKKSLTDAFVGSQYGINLEMVEKDFANYREKLTKYFKTTVYFLAEIEQRIVGVVAAPNDRIIRTMWIDPDFQRQGIGQKLMQMAIEELGDLSEIRLETGLQKNGQAVKFYEKLGFEKTGKESKIKLFPEQTGEVECIELVLKPEKITEIIKQSQTEKSERQDQNWIINNLGWIDVKPIFRDSNFKVFADLCEDQEIKSMLNTDNEKGNEKLLESIFRERSEKPETIVLFVNENFDPIKPQKEFLYAPMIDLDRLVNENSNFEIKALAKDFFKKPEYYIKNYQKEIDRKVDTIFPEFSNIKKISIFKYGELFNSIGISTCNLLILQVENSKLEQVFSKKNSPNNPLTYWEGGCLEVVKYFKNNNNKNSRVQSLVIKNGVDKFSRSDLDKIQEIGRSFGLPGIAYIQFEKSPSLEDGGVNGRGFALEDNTTQTPPALWAAPKGALQAKSPILKFFGDEAAQKAKQQEIVDFLGIESGDLVLFVAHSDKDLVHKAQNAIRKHVALKLDLLDSNSLKFVWIYDFPFFEKDDKTDKIDFAHNPFGIFQNFENLTHLETLKLAQKENRLLELRAIQYDIACNGYEVLSGGRRNNIPECLMEGFKLVGYTEEEVKEKFGHMMEAYSYGAPTHAGFAWGIDRLFMVLVEEDNIRETIAFPKNGSGMDLMMNSPSSVRPIQLKELHIKSVE